MDGVVVIDKVEAWQVSTRPVTYIHGREWQAPRQWRIKARECWKWLHFFVHSNDTSDTLYINYLNKKPHIIRIIFRNKSDKIGQNDFKEQTDPNLYLLNIIP